MTMFDTETDRYLERLGASHSSADWNDVVERANRARRRSRATRAAVGVGATVTVAAVTLAAVGALGGAGSTSIVEKAEAAVLAPVQAAPGTIEHILVQYRMDSGETFIEYESWIAGDGASCRRTVEGTPGQAPNTRLTLCRLSDDVVELYLPRENQILRARVGAEVQEDSARQDSRVPAAGDGPLYYRVRELPDGSKHADIVIKRDGKYYKILEVGTADGSSADLPSADWLREDVVQAFRQDAVREDGTMVLDGREYTKLVTEDGLNVVLVDPETGEAVAWIPSPKAFGVPTTVVRMQETLPDNAENRRSLSLTDLHPDALVRDVTADELGRAIQAQYPLG
jgi:hypothetical protein